MKIFENINEDIQLMQLLLRINKNQHYTNQEGYDETSEMQTSLVFQNSFEVDEVSFFFCAPFSIQWFWVSLVSIWEELHWIRAFAWCSQMKHSVVDTWRCFFTFHTDSKAHTFASSILHFSSLSCINKRLCGKKNTQSHLFVEQNANQRTNWPRMFLIVVNYGYEIFVIVSTRWFSCRETTVDFGGMSKVKSGHWPISRWLGTRRIFVDIPRQWS